MKTRGEYFLLIMRYLSFVKHWPGLNNDDDAVMRRAASWYPVPCVDVIPPLHIRPRRTPKV